MRMELSESDIKLACCMYVDRILAGKFGAEYKPGAMQVYAESADISRGELGDQVFTVDVELA